MKDTEFVAYDQDTNREIFASSGDDQKAGLRLKLNIPLEKSQPAPAYTLLGDPKTRYFQCSFQKSKQYLDG
ncbi:hypothetical protein ACHAXM_008679 [Skeletonema potamos]